MEISVKKTGPCTTQISIVISPEEVNEELNKNFKQTAEAVAFPGFRKGKAPKKLVLKKFGDLIKEDVKEKLLKDAISEAIEKHKLLPVTEPDIDLSSIDVQENKSIEYNLEMETKPDFELGEYKDLEVEISSEPVKDSDIDEGIRALQSRFAHLKSVPDQIVDSKHYVTADLLYQVEGEEELKKESSQINMGLKILDGIEMDDELEKLKGKKIDDTVQLKIPALPEHFTPENMRGMEASVQIQVKDIREISIPEVGDDFLKKVGMSSVEELREKIGKEVENKHNAEKDEEIEKKCLDILIEKHPFDVPEKLLMEQISTQEQNLRYEFMRMGIAKEKIEEEASKFDDKNREAAERNIRVNFIYDKIAEKESIYVTENEVEEELAKIAQQQNITLQEAKKQYAEYKLIPGLRNYLRNQKIRSLLRKNAKVTEKIADDTSEDDKDASSNQETESSV